VRQLVLVCVGVAAAFAIGGVSRAADKKAPAAEPMTVYDTALAAGWENWSWAKTELSVELTGSPRKPIKVMAGPWEALYLHHAPFSTAGLKKIDMLIQGSAPDGQVRLIALIDGKPANEGHLIKLANTGWTHLVTPLAELGAADKTVDGLWVQNATPNELPKFFVTEIKIE